MRLKIKSQFFYPIAIVMILSLTVLAGFYAISLKQPVMAIIIGLFGLSSMMLSVWAIDQWMIKKTYKDLYDHYFNYHKDMQPKIADFTSRYNKLVQELSEQREHYGHFANLNGKVPIDKAILANMTDRGVSASSMSSIVELAKELGPEDTLMLLRINHEKSIWKLNISGKTIHIDQAEKILERVKTKAKKMAKPGGIISAAIDKIYN